MFAHRYLSLFALLIALTAVGCTGVDRDTDRDQELSEMDEDDTDVFCEDVEQGAQAAEDDLEMVICAVGAAVSAGLQAGEDEDQFVTDCNEIYDDCLSGESDENGEDNDSDAECDFDADLLEGCDATAGDYFDCQDEQLEAASTLADNFTCESFIEDDQDLDEAMDHFDGEGPACQSLYDTCPQLQ